MDGERGGRRGRIGDGTGAGGVDDGDVREGGDVGERLGQHRVQVEDDLDVGVVGGAHELGAVHERGRVGEEHITGVATREFFQGHGPIHGPRAGEDEHLLDLAGAGVEDEILPRGARIGQSGANPLRGQHLRRPSPDAVVADVRDEDDLDPRPSRRRGGGERGERPGAREIARFLGRHPQRGGGRGEQVPPMEHGPGDDHAGVSHNRIRSASAPR